MFVQPEENPTATAPYVPFKIDSNIPPPPEGKGGKYTDTLRQMKVGDSFVAPREPNTQGSILSAAKSLGFKIRTRSYGTNEIRVWRLS